MDASLTLAENVVATQYNDIPDDVVEITKLDILDTIGVALAGSAAHGVDPVGNLIREWGGKAESTVLVHGHRVPAPNAALINGLMARALDYDNTYYVPFVCHIGVNVVPAALAMAERKGKVHGRDFITAVALGEDLMVRLGLARKRWFGDRPVFAGGTYPPFLINVMQYRANFGAAAAAGKILGLDTDRMVDALGLAYTQCANEVQSTEDGAYSKRLPTAMTARAGVMAALFAEGGLTGPKNCLEGRFGLFKTFEDGGYIREVLTEQLGHRFEGLNLAFKLYPFCRGGHTALDATLSLVNEHNIHRQDVEAITVDIGPVFYGMMCEPLEFKQKPRSIVDAQFSIPYAVAAAVVDREAGLRHLTERAIARGDLLEVARKVTPRLRSDIKPGSSEETRSTVTIQTRQGQTFSKTVDVCRGRPENPASQDELFRKFRTCAEVAAKPLPRNQVEDAIGLLTDLQNVDDVTRIIRLLVA